MKADLNKFRFFAPVDTIEKAKDKDGNEVYKVGGIISDDSRDADGESLDANGFDFSEFSFINWNHGKSPSDIIGEPEAWKVIPGKGVYMEGYIYPDSDKGRDAVKLMKTLQKSKKGNHLGWSLEGQVLERDMMDRTKVTKAKITSVALCPFPKNGNTFAELLKKGFDDCWQEDDSLEFEKGEDPDVIIDVKDEEGDRVIVNKAGEMKVIKAMDTENSAPLRKEALEGDMKVLDSITKICKAHKAGQVGDDVLKKALATKKHLENKGFKFGK